MKKFGLAQLSRLRAWVLAEDGARRDPDIQLSALRVILLASQVLTALVGGHVIVMAWIERKPLSLVIVVAVLLLLALALRHARRNRVGGAMFLLAAVWAASLAIICTTGSLPELSRLGYVLLYASPMVAGLLLSWRLALLLMASNVLPFGLAMSGYQAPQLPAELVSLPHSLQYVHATLFVFFNVCLPLAVFRVVNGAHQARSQLQASVRRESFATWHDALTGLPNRARCIQLLDQALVQDSQRHWLLLGVRIANLRQLNARYGVAVGDALLREFVRVLQGQLQAHEPARAWSARVRGSVLMLWLPQPASTTQTEALARLEALAAALPRQLCLQQQSIALELTLGALRPQELPTSQQQGAELLRCCELALDMAQDPRRREDGALLLYSAATAQALARSMSLEAELPRALAQDQLRLVYQPKFSPQGHWLGFEALLRWHSPVLGEVSPAEFIPVAEDCGLVCRLSDWVVQAACRQLAEWRSHGLTLRPVAVNLSARDLERCDLDDMLQQSLVRHGLSPALLELELTESALARHPAQALAQLWRLHEAGFSVAIDDFGTGYSSLARLVELPIDVLKIDRRFLHQLPGDARRERVLRSMVSMAHSLGLKLVAEGVETPGQRRLLQALGVQGLQGWLLGRPEPAAHWTALLVQGRGLAALVPQPGV
jgi:diguanylate cyclase (GGDEF)-like protein